MKVGTDGVLLGAWADFSNCENILDIGSGSGLISLMAAQRSNANITAVEIEENAYLQSKQNFENSIWSERITATNRCFIKFSDETTETFDHIVCNPPFFSNSLKNPDEKKSIARHNDILPFKKLIKQASKLLKPNGKISLIVPVETKNDLMSIAGENNLFYCRITYVKPNIRKAAKRILIEFSKQKNSPEINILTIEKDQRHSYTKKYSELCLDFYLFL